MSTLGIALMGFVLGFVFADLTWRKGARFWERGVLVRDKHLGRDKRFVAELRALIVATYERQRSER